MSDLINRQDVMIGLTRKIVSTNPEDFYAHDKFMKFQNNPEIVSYGRWEWANGYNTAIVSMRIELDKMPSAERKGKWLEMGTNKDGTHNIKCSKCGEGYKTRGHARSIATKTKYKFCPNCGASMVRGEEDA